MTTTVALPHSDGSIERYALRGGGSWTRSGAPFRSRIAYAAAHVVSDATDAENTRVDWEATLAYRRHLWSYGFAIAEAMDTAQRGSGLTWPTAKELIKRSLAESRAQNGVIACGAGTDHLPAADTVTVGDVERAYAEQVGYVEGEGGRVILMASRALARAARDADDYRRVYGNVLRQVKRPVILHWLGDMFDPALAGYWGTQDLDEAMNVCLSIITAHADKVDGIKISLLDAGREIDMRRRLPAGVRMYTGDDFHYDQLILGDASGHSDALLGIFDGIAPAAAAALQALDSGDIARYHALLAPTVALSRHIFHAPTHAYKTGLVFLAYLNGHQAHFRMLAGAERARSALHLAELVRLADAAGLLEDPELAATRVTAVLSAGGIS